MSTTISPVTHTEETVVNNAVIGGVAVPLSADTGQHQQHGSHGHRQCETGDHCGGRTVQ